MKLAMQSSLTYIRKRRNDAVGSLEKTEIQTMSRSCLLRRLCVWMVVSLVGFGHGQVNMAVLDFENNSIMEREKWMPLTGGLAQILISEIDPIESIRVVERRRLKSLMDEVKLAQSGMLDERQTVSVGKLAGARFMLFGSYLVTLDEKIRIDLRIVDVETSETLKAGQQTGKAKDFLKLMKMLVRGVFDDLSIPLTSSETDRLKSGTGHPVEALLAYSKGIAHEDAGALREAVTCYRQALSLDPKFEAPQIQMDQIRKRLLQNQNR